jgi:peptide/nickel transport system substrate-binding protein
LAILDSSPAITGIPCKEGTVDENKTRITRREFLRLTALVGAGVTAAACGAPAPAPTAAPAAPKATEKPAAPQPTAVPKATEKPVTVATAAAAPTAAPTSKYKEAPALAELVKAGKLPPVDQRLPKNPKAQKPFAKVGKYGGTWRRAYRGASDRFGVHTTIADHLLEMDAPEGAGSLTLIPNVAESYKVNADGTEFTWKLREGHKWSDGVEITSENAVWWFKNVLLNEELAPGRLYDNVRQQQNLTDIVADGKYAFVCKYSKPNGTLPLGVVRGEAWGLIGGLNFLVPSHYLQKFHRAFADPKALDEEVAKRKLQSWKQLWIGGPIDMFAFNPDLPIVGPWVTKQPASNERMVQERNPFYFQVDSEGNQLPYIDQITHDFFENQESFNLMCVAGKVDCQFRHVQLKDYTLLKENEAKGNYKVYVWADDSNVGWAINPTPRNEDTKVDEAQSAIVSKADFRRALSHAINRKEVSSLLYKGLAEPRQGAPVKGSPVYKKEYEEKFAAYDVDQANKLLDGLGLKKGADGFRTRPDGKPMTLRLDVDTAPGTINDDLYQLTKKYWEAVGIKTNINAMERSLREQIQFSDRYSVVGGSPGNTATPLAYDAWHFTIGGGWGRYIRNPKDPLAIQPPAGNPDVEPATKCYKLIEEAYSMADLDAAHKKLMEALDIYYDQCYSIGIVGAVAVPGVITNRMKNVPQKMLFTNALMRINMGQPAQFYIEE